VEDFRRRGRRGSALIVRIHHCIADGIALISVTMSLVDGGSEPPERKRRTSAAGAEDWICRHPDQALTDSPCGAGRAGDGAAKLAACCATRKRACGLRCRPGRALAYQVLSDAAALALMPDDSPPASRASPARTKRVAWCPPIPLDEVKAVGKALNCSVNDVLLSCVAGAIGGYLRDLGDDVTGQEIRAMIPVNLRPLDQAYKLGNRFGLAPLVLPIGVENPIERIYEVRRRMTALKGSTQPLLAFGLLAVAGLLIKPAQDAMLNLFGKQDHGRDDQRARPARASSSCCGSRWSSACSGCRSRATSAWACPS
jgi:diacylglycerol O-acyltransferase